MNNHMDAEIDYVAEKKRARIAKKKAQKGSTAQVGEGSFSSGKTSEVAPLEGDEAVRVPSPPTLLGDGRAADGVEVT